MAEKPILALLSMAKEMVDLGATQAQLRKWLGDSNGIRLYHIVMLDSRYPNLHILDRMKMLPKETGFINVFDVDYRALQDFGQRLTPESTEVYNKKFASKPKSVLTENEVKEYFASIDNRKLSIKMMEKGKIRMYAETLKNYISQNLAGAILEPSEAAKFQVGDLDKTFGAACNCVVSLKDNISDVEEILMALEALPAGKIRTKYLADIKAMLEVEN